MLLNFLSNLCSQSLKNFSSPSIIYLMSWLTTKADHVSSFSSLYPLSLYKLHSFGCLPVVIDVCHCHSLLNANYMCTLATLPLLTMPVCADVLVFTLSAVLSAPSKCVFNSFVFNTHKHRLFQNNLASLSRDQSSWCLSFSLSITFSISLPCF